jgi:hypothetical protein
MDALVKIQIFRMVNCLLLLTAQLMTAFWQIYFYVKTKTIVYYHLRQCFREKRLSSQSKQ